ncbi:hypothetical protein BDP27DRAFT_1497662 [Rhodocollybia butyracea]|uniref:Uncharacterized protein n=1 Tax=Rhodocollybia butyracea TaxID=206335 RepID=A0A9P5PT64_9AGAR|nr:hypothetical protein BDP27DRAFT_1497662 [Rhodocollybia butyracea]
MKGLHRRLSATEFLRHFRLHRQDIVKRTAQYGLRDGIACSERLLVDIIHGAQKGRRVRSILSRVDFIKWFCQAIILIQNGTLRLMPMTAINNEEQRKMKTLTGLDQDGIVQDVHHQWIWKTMNTPVTLSLAAQQEQLENYIRLVAIIEELLTVLVMFQPFSSGTISLPFHTAEEIQYIWKLPVRASTVLFICNRSCKPFYILHEVALALTQTLVAALMTIRIYVLYRCSKRVLTYLAVTVFMLAVPSAFFIFFDHSSQSELTSTGCHTEVGFITMLAAWLKQNNWQYNWFPQLNYSIEAAASWEAVFLYDLILFAMTLHIAYKARHELQLEGVKMPLFSIIIRDGSMYFA